MEDAQETRLPATAVQTSPPYDDIDISVLTDEFQDKLTVIAQADSSWKDTFTRFQSEVTAPRKARLQTKVSQAADVVKTKYAYDTLTEGGMYSKTHQLLIESGDEEYQQLIRNIGICESLEASVREYNRVQGVIHRKVAPTNPTTTGENSTMPLYTLQQGFDAFDLGHILSGIEPENCGVDLKRSERSRSTWDAERGPSGVAQAVAQAEATENNKDH